MLERQVEELTQRNEQIGEIMRNLARIRNMDSQIRGMLGLGEGDEKKKDFFGLFKEHYDVTFLDDYMDVIEGVNPNYYGTCIMDQF